MGTKVKVLLCITQGAEMGGAQLYILTLAASLSSEKYDITVAAGSDGYSQESLLREARARGLKTLELKWLRRDMLPYQDLRALIELNRLIRREKFEIVHFVSTKAGVLGRLAARILCWPISIFTAQGFVFNEPSSSRKRAAYILAERFCGWAGDYLITVARYEERQALEYKIGRAGRISTIHNGIDLGQVERAGAGPQRDEWREHFGLEGSIPVIGTIANFYPAKGLSILLETAALLKPKFPEARFVVIGDGPLRAELESLRKELALENYVILAGEYPEAARLLTMFDLFVLPSVKEGLPFALLEAMAAGLPCIATSVGGIPDAIEHGVSGWLVPPGEPSALADAIERLLNNRETGTRLGQTARQKVQTEFDYRRMVERTEAVYQKLLSEKTGQS